MCYFDYVPKLYTLPRLRVTAYKAVWISPAGDIYSITQGSRWVDGEMRRSGRERSAGIYSFRKKKHAEKWLGGRESNNGSVIVKLRLSGKVTRYLGTSTSYPGYISDRAKIVEIYR